MHHHLSSQSRSKIEKQNSDLQFLLDSDFSSTSPKETAFENKNFGEDLISSIDKQLGLMKHDFQILENHIQLQEQNIVSAEYAKNWQVPEVNISVRPLHLDTTATT